MAPQQNYGKTVSIMDVQKKTVPVAVKVCGVTLAADVAHCLRRRVAYVGFNFYPGSKRYITPVAAAGVWAAPSTGGHKGAVATLPVAVIVKASLAEVAQMLLDFPALGVIQVHGPQLVTADYLRQLRQIIGARPLWLAWPVATPQEVAAAVTSYATLIDLLLFDSQHLPQGASVAGGSGVAFDWQALSGCPAGLEFGVAGGLNADNIGALAEAIQPLRPVLLDLCSGVERVAGQKDTAMIDAVLQATGGAW